MRHAIAAAFLLFVGLLSLPVVVAQNVWIAGYISDGTNGSWFLTEEVCHSMRPTRIYPLDPSQSSLWTQYQGNGGTNSVVILRGEFIKTGQTTYFHAESVTTMTRDAFCIADPMGVPEITDVAETIVAVLFVVTLIGLKKSRQPSESST